MDEETKQILIKAGAIASQVRREGAAKLKIEGTSFLEVMDYCEERIKELGGEVAWAQLALNETAAHYCPAEDDTATSKEGDLIKIDVGVHIEGWIADNAMTVEVGDKGLYTDLITASQNALRETIKLIKPGVTLTQLGESQMNEAKKLGCTTVRNLCGHTLGQFQVHGGISIPTYKNNDNTALEEGWQVAIEPFITKGEGLIKEAGTSTIFMVEKNATARSPYARKILDQIKNLNGLPFTTRWLTRTIGKGPTALGLRELLKSNIIRSYPPLVEVSKGMVAQFEHSMIVTKDGPLVYTRHKDDTW